MLESKVLRSKVLRSKYAVDVHVVAGAGPRRRSAEVGVRTTEEQ